MADAAVVDRARSMADAGVVVDCRRAIANKVSVSRISGLRGRDRWVGGFGGGRVSMCCGGDRLPCVRLNQ